MRGIKRLFNKNYIKNLLNTFEWKLIKAFEYSLEHKRIRTTLLYSDERKH